MAATINEPIYSGGEQERGSALDNALGSLLTLNLEKVVIITILLLAIFTRFYDLGARAMSHDESLHVYYAYELYTEGKFNHTPLMHGPILFHATAFFYSILGDNDFTGRIYAALLGVFMVMTPLLFRRWLGTWGAILACLMILGSPLLMYYNRYIRHDTPSILSAMLMVWAIMMYLNGPENQRRRAHWLYIIAVTLLWNLGSKETSFIYVAIIGNFLLLYWLVRLLQYFRNIPGQVWFKFAAMGVLIAGVLALGMFIILDIAPLERVTELAAAGGWFGDLMPRSFILWTLLAVLVTAVVVVGTLFYAFRGRFGRLPLRELLLIAAIAAVVLVGFITVEELSHIETSANDVPINQPAPGEEGVTTVTAGGFTLTPIIAIWVVMGVVLVGLWYSRRAGWWVHLDQFPELDVMIVIGALILPWLTAVFIVATHGTTEDFTAIGTSVPQFLTGIFPVSGTLQTGQFIVGVLAWLPMMVIAVATGLTWNWRRFLIAWLLFHALFAFFFTTVFTNIQGLATGMIYSLQYWLEQQGERRGNQPQYYYLLIILPLYEFLPIIGSVLAMVSGLVLFWRQRRDLDEARLVTAGAITDEAAKSKVGDDGELISTESAEPGLLVEGEKPKRGMMSTDEAQQTHARLRPLTGIPFLLLVSWWAILMIIALTLAGEKMPWLGTHMTTPMIFLTAWYFGSIFERIDWSRFRQQGWIYLLLVPFLLVLGFQLIAGPLGGRTPFAGTSLEQIQATNAWLAAAALVIVVAVGIYRLAQMTGWQHFRQMFAMTLFGVLLVLTFRSAWMASFINYDMATEFLVYAHASPGTKMMADKLEELSLETTNGYTMKFAYDDKMSWPGVWYFRHYTNEVYMGKNPTLQSMEGSTVVVVGEANRSVVEPLLEDRYQRFEYTRMWWPMMDYFNLSPQRIIDTFYLTAASGEDATKVDKAAQVRRGLFDIWWNRDYTVYGQAIGKSFEQSAWPVQEKMYMYVRKDVAAQVWNYGTGDGSITNVVEEQAPSACVTNWQQPVGVPFNVADAGLRSPLGLAVSPEGKLYVADADANNSRLAQFDAATGEFLGFFGGRGTADQIGAFFERPNSVSIGSDGTIYVVDTWNYRVRTFNAAGEPLIQWGTSLAAGFDAPVQPTDGFWGPREVIADAAGNVYVADTGNKRVRVYDANGSYLRDIGSGGSGPGELDEPSGLAISADGRLFVADSWNRRISVFTTDGTFLTTYPLNAWFEVQGNRPYLAIDPTRPILYVTDPDGGRVLVLTLDGQCLGAFGRPNRENAGSSEFAAIGGIAVDQNGMIYISDTGGGSNGPRILRFDPFPLTDEQLNPPGDVNILPEVTAEVGIEQVEIISTAEVVATEEVLTTEEVAGTAEISAPETTDQVQP